ncbi:MAG: polysaccharide biosynthesis protein [Prevotella sp.]|nr:polysaccharide biosynthesis protein [Prevotella sp.]
MNPLNKIIHWYFSKKALPYWSILVFDSLVLFVSGLATSWLFYRGYYTQQNFYQIARVLLLYVMLSWIGMRLFNTYSGIIRYSSFVDLRRVTLANLTSLLIAWGVHYLVYYVPPSTLEHFNSRYLFVMFTIATVVMYATRVIIKSLFDITTTDSKATRVLIYGTMSSAVALAKSIRFQEPVRFVLRGFITHDIHDRHDQLMGERVYSVDDDLQAIVAKERIGAVLVSPLRNDEFRKAQRLQDKLINAGLKIYMAQGVEEWTGENEDIQMKEMSVEDLLPRNEIKIDMESVGNELAGKCILITGSAGSIGSEMVRQIAHYKPAHMILIDQAETPQHDIRLMMAHDFSDIKAEIIVTSISRQTRMENIFKTYRPDYVFHAAAYKHVPMMEDNPSEAVMNNIYGTKVIADMSVKYGVKKFVMVSTDKAVNPTNVMGCSKRICEIYVQSLNCHIKQDNPEAETTQFVTTRFGNVLGSNGSVIPMFKKQIQEGGPVTVTHPDIIRYFMLIPEACQLVLEAGTKGHGGEIFIFDMGQPVRIADLAARMIKLSGVKNVETKYTGLREGEKLYEEMLNDEECTKPSFHEKIRIAKVREYDYKKACEQINELIDLAKQYDNMETVRKMKEIVPEYKSNNSIYEWLDKQ